jgi:hypothetical protein
MPIKMGTPIAAVCWPLSSLAETVTSDHASAACYRRIKNIRIHAVVVAELKLRDVQRQIFGADFVERPHNATLEDAPETFNRIGVNSTNNILLFFVMYGLTRIFLQAGIDLVFVGRQQANLVGYRFANESFDVRLVHVIQYAGNNIALALYCADDRDFAGASAAALAVMALVPMAVVVFAADPSFINLDNAAKLIDVFFNQRRADTVAHVPSGFVGTEAHVAMDLPCAHSLFAREHEVNDAEPLPQIDVRVLENGSGDVGEPIAAVAAIRALPFEFHGFEGIGPVRATTGANDAIGPAAGDQIGVTSIFIGEVCLKLADCHLRDLLGLSAGHASLLSSDSHITRYDLSVKSGIIASWDVAGRSIRYGRPNRGAKISRSYTGVTRARLSQSRECTSRTGRSAGQHDARSCPGAECIVPRAGTALAPPLGIPSRQASSVSEILFL